MKKLALVCLAAVFIAGTYGGWRLHQRTKRLEARAAELRHSAADPSRARDREELRRINAVIAQVKGDAAQRAEVVRVERAAARREVAALEARAQSAYVARFARERNKVENRDPEKGMARLEYFQNVGRATPAAAVQTLAWAVLKGDDATLASCISLTNDARRAATEWLSKLPPEMHAKYPTPESLAALAMTDEVLKSAAARINGFTAANPNEGIVIIHLLETGEQPRRIPVTLGPAGWQIVVSQRTIEAMRKQVDEPPAAANAKSP